MSEAVARPGRLMRLAVPALLVVAVGSFVAAIVLPPPWKKQQAGAEPAPADTGAVLPFALTERSGAPVSNADLAGKVWVASFVFTRCTGPCPSVTATMARLQADLDLEHQPDLRLVSFTVDPDRDTPDALRKYAEHYRAHPTRWLFLTGKEDEIHRLARDGFKIAADRTKDPQPREGQEFDHSTRLVLVDKTGHIRGYFDGYQGEHDADGRRFADGYARLKEAVAELLKE